MQYFPCCYFCIDAHSVPLCRYIDPQAPLVVAVTGIDDRDMLNLCLLDRYLIGYEPYNFKGYLEDFPLTLAYGKKIDALRRKYAEYLWDATFRDTLGAEVTADGDHRYSVFVTATGKRAVVVSNLEPSKTIAAKVAWLAPWSDRLNSTGAVTGSTPWGKHPGKLEVATPEHLHAEPTTGTLKSPARSAAVVMEQ